MGTKLEIEEKLITRIGKQTKHFILARCLDSEPNFSVTENSRLNDIEICNYLDQPRVLDKKGNPRLDIFAFKIRHKKDWDKLKTGEIVELIHKID